MQRNPSNTYEITIELGWLASPPSEDAKATLERVTSTSTNWLGTLIDTIYTQIADRRITGINLNLPDKIGVYNLNQKQINLLDAIRNLLADYFNFGINNITVNSEIFDIRNIIYSNSVLITPHYGAMPNYSTALSSTNNAAAQAAAAAATASILVTTTAPASTTNASTLSSTTDSLSTATAAMLDTPTAETTETTTATTSLLDTPIEQYTLPDDLNDSSSNNSSRSASPAPATNDTLTTPPNTHANEKDLALSILFANIQTIINLEIWNAKGKYLSSYDKPSGIKEMLEFKNPKLLDYLCIGHTHFTKESRTRANTTKRFYKLLSNLYTNYQDLTPEKIKSETVLYVANELLTNLIQAEQSTSWFNRRSQVTLSDNDKKNLCNMIGIDVSTINKAALEQIISSHSPAAAEAPQTAPRP